MQAFRKALIPTLAGAITGSGLIGYKYYTNGQLGNQRLFHTNNTSLVQQHKQFVSTLQPYDQQQQQLQQSQNNNTIPPPPIFTPTTITPNGTPYEFKKPKPRSIELNEMAENEYDLLIIGGGISGCASAHEASTRGFKVALVEKGDFSGCTSSRSTKLIHGGVRYLEQAFKTFDFGLLSLVSEALHERSHMINATPYMNEPIPIIIPLSKYWEIPYMGVGVLLYDLVAAFEKFPRGHIISKKAAIDKFPMLDCDKLDLKAALVYYDGQMNDSRYTLSLALTAGQNGANVANYLEVVGLQHDENGHLISATVQDTLSPSSPPFTIKCKSILNTAGPFADVIRKMDDNNAQELIVPSSGTHIVLPSTTAPSDYGMLIPKTPDGRVLFLLPWEDAVIAGTTDAPSEICDVPQPSKNDVKYIIDIVNQYIKQPINENDVKSVWSGLRPLVKDPTQLNAKTSKLSRNHLVLSTKSHLTSLMGGKFTTNRQMAQDAIDEIIKNNDYFGSKSNDLNDVQNQFKRTSTTFNQPIYGADDASILLNNDFNTLRPVLEESYNIDTKTADYIARNYGTRSLPIAQNAYQQCLTIDKDTTILNSKTKLNKKCILNAEIDYVVEFELAQRAEDVLFRRNRMGFTNTDDVKDNTPYVINYMGSKLNWDNSRKVDEQQRVQFLLDRMDYNVIKTQPL